MTASIVLYRISYALLVVGAALALVVVWGLHRPAGEGGANIGLGILALAVPWVLAVGLVVGATGAGAALLTTARRRGRR
ncbi:hypothetical protein WDV85_09580 [Pseudokineococcus sp. 5B2Z-1]|uniref:hypothetical protein n=1 Tax=Pseudokineococcus sp. 5B2Z-1 TaxID=3132744 RepID=UPI0030A0F19F